MGGVEDRGDGRRDGWVGRELPRSISALIGPLGGFLVSQLAEVACVELVQSGDVRRRRIIQNPLERPSGLPGVPDPTPRDRLCVACAHLSVARSPLLE
jgi:hypothetical protein